MKKYERQALAKVVRMAGECLNLADSYVTVEDPGEEIEDVMPLLDIMHLLRAMTRYRAFDLEATRRERDQLQHIIDGSGGSCDEE
jgi:hypothetical protein